MANVLVNAEKKIEMAAEDALKWLAGADNKLQAAPQAIAGLAVLLGHVQKCVIDVQADATNPLNITLLPAQVADFKHVWPDVRNLAFTLGIKL